MQAKPREAPPATVAAGRRKFWFRVIAVGVPLLNLVLLEVILRAAGYGYSASFFLRSRTNGVPVFVENQAFSRRYFPPGLERTPLPVILPVAKPTDTIRVFVFGESAAMGDPEPAFGFGRILEVMLRAAMPGKRIEVVNVAVTAINSHVIREIARDCADKQGDYWLIYMGNNEVVGPFGAGTIFGQQVPGRAVIRANLALKTLRLGQLLDALWVKLSGQRGTPDTWLGMEMFLRQQVPASDPKMPRVYEHFEANLRDIIRQGQRSGAQVIVSTVPVNLKDCPPFASQHRPGLGEAQRAEWERFYQAGIERERAGDNASAQTNFQQAATMDDQFAELWFRLGRCDLALSNAAGAKPHFERARDLDTLRFRADSRINESIAYVASDFQPDGVRCLDAPAWLQEHGAGAIAGEELFYEHVHPNFTGNYLLARMFAESILGAATNHPALPGMDDCARRLAFTDFNRYQILDEVRQRLQQPPFTQQLDHERREARLRKQLDTMQRASLTNAFQIYEDALAQTPDDWMLHENYAKLLQDFDEPRRAEAQWTKVIQLRPHYEEALYSLGNNLDAQGRPAEAIPFFRLALQRRPRSFEARHGLALALANLGQWDAAVEQYERVLGEKPDFAEARVNLGQALAQQGKLPEALAQYRQALRFDSNNVAAHISLGKLLAREGKLAEAAAEYREALRLKPEHAVAHYNLANALSAAGDRAGAASHLAEAVRHRPNFAEARYNLGLHLAKQGDNEGALEQFGAAARLKPDWADARFNFGVALAKARRFDEAAEQFRETLRLQPGNEQARRFLEQAQARGSK